MKRRLFNGLLIACFGILLVGCNNDVKEEETVYEIEDLESKVIEQYKKDTGKEVENLYVDSAATGKYVYHFSITNEEGKDEVIQIYMVDPKTGKGVDIDDKPVDFSK